MAISNFDVNAKEKIVDSLDVSLRSTYEKYKSQELLPSEAYDKGILSSNSIITGFPKKIDSKSDFNGVISTPCGEINRLQCPLLINMTFMK